MTLVKPTERVFVVTGSSTGIGRALCDLLAQAGHTVVMVSRDPQRATAAVAAVREASGNPNVHSMPTDLSLMSEVQRLAAEVRSRFPAIHGLINNAALLPLERRITKEGLDECFATNCVALLLLTHLLAEPLKSTRGRVVNFFGGDGSTFDRDDLQRERAKFDPWKSYAQSKMCDAMLTQALAQRFAGQGVTVNAVLPGLVNTPGMRSIPGAFGWMMVLFRPFMRTPAQGAAIPLWAATAPELDGVTGKTFGSISGDWKKEYPLPPAATAPDNIRRVYETCAGLAGI